MADYFAFRPTHWADAGRTRQDTSICPTSGDSELKCGFCDSNAQKLSDFAHTVVQQMHL